MSALLFQSVGGEGCCHATLHPFFCLTYRYRDDFRPLVEGCECYCCQNHKRAYLHHLLVTKELLAGVLLMLHNLAHYGGFFSALRRALESGHFETLKSKVLGLSRSVS